MKILLDIGHPGHVHLFRNAYFSLKDNHNIFVTARNNKIISRLLNYYKIPFIDLGHKKDTLYGKAITVLRDDLQLLSLTIKYKIDIGISSGIVLSHISGLSKIKTIIFDDDDDAVEPLLVKFGHPFADSVVSPDSISRKAKNTVSYSGTHELAYLHPAYFTPDPAVLKDYGINNDEKYFILRFVAFKGHHDVGQSGVSYEQKLKLTELLKGYGRVFITAEREIEPELEQYRVPVPPEKMHSFMAYATMFLGDSQTMTSEAAILGVPALKCNTFAGKLSVPNELEQIYGLCYSYQPSDFDKFYQHVESLLSRPDLKQEWKQKKEKFLADKIDVTAFMVWFVENYPESKRIMKENPEYQYRFK